MRLNSIQAFRAIAALLVLAAHTNLLLPREDGAAIIVMRAAGMTGVGLFFVISGFVMATALDRATAEAGSRPRQAGLFLAARMLRIYPAYWLVAAAMILASGWLSSAKVRPWGVADLLLLTPDNAILEPAWTLSYEMLFYAICAGAILVAGRRAGAMAALGAGLCAVAFTPLTGSSLPVVQSAPMVFDFVLGIGAAVAVRRASVTPALLWALLGCGALVFCCAGLFSLTVSEGWDGWTRVACTGAPAALLVFAAACLEQQGRLRMPGPLVFLGDASYALYLWQYPVLLAAKAAGWTAERSLPSLAVGVTLALAVSVAAHLVLEAPFLTLSHRWLRAMRSRSKVDVGNWRRVERGTG